MHKNWPLISCAAPITTPINSTALHTTSAFISFFLSFHKCALIMGFSLEPPSSRTSAIAIMFSCFWLIFLVQSSVAKVIQLKWEVEYKHWSPDCIESVVMATNGTFPGPTIEATAGDTINITLTNLLFTEGLVIHWHGITQVCSI